MIGGGEKQRNRKSSLSLSEIMILAISSHQSGFRNMKTWYKNYILRHRVREFPSLVSYTRFVELLSSALVPLCYYLNSLKGKDTEIAYVDSTPIKVCHNRRISRHRVFDGLAERGKHSMGWFYGFKLHLIVNEKGEMLAFHVTPGNIDDRSPVVAMSKQISGKLFGDRGYISQKLEEALSQQGINFMTTLKKNMKPRVRSQLDQLLLRKRSLIETINDQLKNISQTEHSRCRSPKNFMVNIFAGLIAYAKQPKKPSLQFHTRQELIL